MTEPTTNIEIRVDYEDDALREQIAEGSTQALGWIRWIGTEDEAMVGGPDSAGMREYLISFLGGLLQCLRDALRGSRSHFTAGNGPVYVVLEPETADAIRFTFAYRRETVESSDARESFEPRAEQPRAQHLILPNSEMRQSTFTIY